ncbi:S-adenosyl-L-methionine-dependent methyltransferase, partial [Gautieria morchelliformis]
MKFSNIVAIVTDLRLSIQQAVRPTLMAIIKSPTLIFRPRALSRLFFYHVWTLFGPGINANGNEVKSNLITPYAKGVVLDIGAGLGHTALYLSPSRVRKYVALEPNVLMHPHIREAAAHVGFSEESQTLLILACGAEDWESIALAIGGQNRVDTIVSVLTLCSVPEPERTIKALADKVLKDGGQFIFYEHVASKRPDVRFWQWFWSPIWKICFDGCVLDRPTDDYIQKLENIWETSPAINDDEDRRGIWGLEGEDKEHLFWHQMGRLIKCSI